MFDGVILIFIYLLFRQEKVFADLIETNIRLRC